MIKWLGIASLFGCGGQKNEQGSETMGPFEIHWEVRKVSSGSWYNNGGDISAKVPISDFSIIYHGKALTLPEVGAEGTKCWQALFLKEAPRPAILAGTHNMFLITEEKGAANISVLDNQTDDFATYQWLDQIEGQPSASQKVFLGDASHTSRFMSGGRWLLINGRTVLDIKELKAYPFDKDSWEALQQLGNYYSRNSQAMAFSPGKAQVVFVGSRNRKEDQMHFEYALVVVDFANNRSYAVPFDQTSTRLETEWDATPSWINTYFEWSKDKAGNELLIKRQLAQLPNWKGKYIIESYGEFEGQESEYQLYPVLPEMLDTFEGFIHREFEVSERQRDTVLDNISVSFQIEDRLLTLYYEREEQKVSLFVPAGLKTRDHFALLKRIGDKFNNLLSEGKYQDVFGHYK